MSTVTRTLWTADVLYSGSGMDGRREVETIEEAILVSSRCVSGRHAPALDIDFPTSLWPRQPDLPGHTVTITLDRQVTPVDPELVAMGQAMADAGLITGLNVAIPDPFRSPGKWFTQLGFQFVVPAVVVPSTHEDHFHLYLEHEIGWLAYADILEKMQAVGILQRGFVQNSISRGQTMLLKPGLAKSDLKALGIAIHGDSA